MSRNKKYYLGFTFSSNPVVGLHCTHAYFGTLSEPGLKNVTDIVDTFFKDFGPVWMPRVAFTTPMIFGGEGEEAVRVLTTRDLEAFQVFDRLRQVFLDLKLISTKYPYRPHVTTKNLGLVNTPFYSYALVCDGRVLKSWPIRVEEKAG